MRLVLFTVCLFVYFVSLSALLCIGVKYVSKQGVNVDYLLPDQQQEYIEFGTENIYLTCINGEFNQTDWQYNDFYPYRQVNNSVYLVQVLFENIEDFMSTLYCYNSTQYTSALISPIGSGLIRLEGVTGGYDYTGLSPGAAVQIDIGTNTGQIRGLTTGNSSANPPSLLRCNGSEVFIHPMSNINFTTTYGARSRYGLQLRIVNFSAADEGEYIFVLVDENNLPLNLSFTLYSQDTDPCNVTTCPIHSECNSTSSTNLCVCDTALEYRNAMCECPPGYMIEVNSSISCVNINECDQSAVCPMNYSCVDTEGSYACDCIGNFTVSSVTQECIHVVCNECHQHSNTTCVRNGDQNYTCECVEGFVPVANGSDCVIVTTQPTTNATQAPTNATLSITNATQTPTNATLSITNATEATTTGPTTTTTAALQEVADRLSSTDSLTSEDADDILNELSSVVSSSSADPNNLASAADLLNQLTDKLSNISDEQVEEFADILSNFANDSILMAIQEDPTSDVSDVIGDIISAVENVVGLLAPLYYENENGTVIEKDNIRIEVNRLDLEEGSVLFGGNSTAEFSLRALLESTFDCFINDSSCPTNITGCQTVGVSVEIKNLNRYVTMPIVEFDSWFCDVVQQEVYDESELMNTANSDLFSFSIGSVLCDNIDTSNLSEPVTFTFKIQDTSQVQPSCVSVAPHNGSGGLEADTQNCRQIGSTSDTISCSCNHLTSFAILMSPDTNYQYSEAMAIFTYVGLSISIVSLIAALLIYTFIRFKVSLSIFFVHYNLMVTVLLSEIVFIVGIDRTEIPELCVIIAVVLHYILLVSFCWMFFEFFNLLKLIFRPKSKQKHIIHLYWILAYGLPLIVVAATVGFSRCNYGNYRGISYPTPMSTNCWLPRRGGTYWAFIGPSLLIIAVNSIMLIVLIIKLIHLKWAAKSYPASALNKSASHTLAEGFVSAIRATLLLLPIMGFTWIFGIFAINSEEVFSLIFQWLFLIFNCLQGFFIFVFYCVLKSEVRDAVLLLLLNKVCRREVRLAEGETVFSTFSIARMLSTANEKAPHRKVTLESPSKSYKQSIGLVPVEKQKSDPNDVLTLTS